MRCAIIAAAVCCVLSNGAGLAADPDGQSHAEPDARQESAASPPYSANDDAQDLLFLGPMRPVLIRLH
ncbi:MAG TPA: hypothetical protein VFU81_19290, partial [Thermomicrobiales bacterium]|nr:hypothetical protein [Thermomicrobiales bacterium]